MTTRCILHLLLLHATVASACEVPVFRFALERWPADPLTVEISAHGPAGEDGKAALQWLHNQVPGQPASNILAKVVDPVDSSGHNLLRLLPAHPPGDGPPAALWSGPLNETNARDLSGSPLRQTIAAKLLGGTSAVWVVVSSGDAAADDAAMRLLDRALARASRDLALPAGVIRPDEAGRKFGENPKATMDDVLRTTLPLAIRFESLLLRHDDPAENILRTILRNLAPPAPPGQPLLAPFFGRGRVLPPAPAAMLDEDAVFQGCAYLCGACACMVKQQNPGIDIPFRTDWDSHLKPHLAVINHPPAATPVTVTTNPAPTSAASNQAPTPAIPAIAAGGVLLLALLALAGWRWRARRQ